MAEARSEEDEERLRETGGGRRSSEHSDRNKPDQRHSSQGALSSIRAVIKRTSARTSSQSDHQRERRRPEITILSAEPLPTNSWFPGASGGFPPAPPPAPPTWAAGSATVQLPPPSYEQVIREKSREQNIQPPIPSSSSPISPPSSSPSSARLSTSSIATQTDTLSHGPQSSAARPVRRPPKPPRPSPPVKNRDSLHEQCGGQTDFDDVIDDVTSTTPAPTDLTLIDSASTFPAFIDSASSPMDELMKSHPRPRPRPRSSIIQPEATIQPMTREVKVQTLVRLKDDTAENVFAGFDDTPSNISSKYLDDLMEVFSPDEAPQSQTVDGEENMKPSESRPQPRPRTLKSKTQITAKPSVFEVFDGGDPEVQQNHFRSPPVPAPRPLLNKPAQVLENTPPGQQGAALMASLSERRNSDDLLLLNKQVFENIPPGQQGAALMASLSERRNSDDLLLLNEHQSPAQVLKNTPPGQQGAELMASLSKRRNSDDLLLLNKHKSPAQDSRPENTPPGQQRAALMSSSSERRNGNEKAANAPAKTPTDRNPGKRPTVPKHSRPPPPVLRKSASTSQVTVDVSSTPETSVPPLPPRPSGNRLLPLRPPPMKVNRPSGSSSSTVSTDQLPDSRVPKRGPPLPPRPRPGHPLYKRYSRTELKEDLEVQNPEQEEPSEETALHQEEQFLIVLDEADVPETPANTLHDLRHSEVKGQDEAVTEVHLEDATSEKQTQQSTQHRLVVACFAFEGEEAELSFSVGDVITLIEYVNEDWGRGSLNGRIGIFPLSFIQAAEETEESPGNPALKSPAPPAGVSSKGRALYDFTAECEDELCLKAGDLVCDLEEMDADWFQGEFGGKRGIVPKNFIQLLQES
ncbi:SH3 domain-containing protein 19 [Danio aesculapii]|uniref:SH3 domain-containing protein 19 n=1 Tax=Danio aesculapii TaxID=1142201 RepID=UPI0024C0523A|nr:SH3 domain-containing protein 19 [Danio aesculapii]